MRGLAKVEGIELLIDSAGTAAYHAGERADHRSRSFAKKRGYGLTSVARQVTVEDFRAFDYVLAMDTENLADLEQLHQKAGSPVCHVGLLRDFDPSASAGSSVPDPYYGGELGFEEVLDQCERACRGLLEHLKSSGRRR
jgi:protein-tyrosine-phosphatase